MLVAAGVVGPGPVAVRVQEPAAALRADLSDHLCRNREDKATPIVRRVRMVQVGMVGVRMVGMG